MITPNRQREFEAVRRTITAWAERDEAIAGAACVGSWARGEPRSDSDIDVVILTDSTLFIEHATWLTEALPFEAELIRTASWGPLTERRARTTSGLDVDVGFVGRFWADIEPIDDGTRQVVQGGCAVWHDPEQLFQRLLDAL